MGKGEFDLAIIGTGPAGLGAAVYAARYRLKTVLIGEQPGGHLAEASTLENFPTYREISGIEAAQKMIAQVQELGVEITGDRVSEIKKAGGAFLAKTATGLEFGAKKIILALGTERRKLGLPGEKKLAGKGICYCATCDAPLYRGKTVGVVGGGNSALSAAILAAQFAEKVFIFYRQPDFFRADPVLAERVKENKKIAVVLNSNVKKLLGDAALKGVALDSGKEIALQGLFVEIGYAPDAGIAKAIGVEISPEGYIKTDREQRTSVPGVFAAGDITDSPLRQAVTAIAQGAVAAKGVFDEIKKGGAKE